MKRVYYLFLIYLLPIQILAATFSELTAQRLDGTAIQYYLTIPATTKAIPLILVLQGSSCNAVYSKASSFGQFSDKNGVARLDLEKYGLDKTTVGCPQAYLDNNSVDQRIHDYLRVLHSIRSGSKSWWNRVLWIVGGSEGGALAPILATYIPEASKVVVMAGGTGWTMREEMLFLLEQELKSAGADNTSVAAELKKMSAIFDEAIANPVSSKSYAGVTNTYRWWNSILNVRPLNFMSQLDIPFLMVHGDVDRAVPVESARASVEFFRLHGKANLKYIEYPGLDHHWKDAIGNSHGEMVLNEVFTWLAQ